MVGNRATLTSGPEWISTRASVRGQGGRNPPHPTGPLQATLSTRYTRVNMLCIGCPGRARCTSVALVGFIVLSLGSWGVLGSRPECGATGLVFCATHARGRHPPHKYNINIRMCVRMLAIRGFVQVQRPAAGHFGPLAPPTFAIRCWRARSGEARFTMG